MISRWLTGRKGGEQSFSFGGTSLHELGRSLFPAGTNDAPDRKLGCILPCARPNRVKGGENGGQPDRINHCQAAREIDSGKGHRASLPMPENCRTGLDSGS